jgi:hypothetical protein
MEWKRVGELRGEIDEHETGAELIGRLLDLGEAVHGGGVDPGDQSEIEQQEVAVRVGCEQGLDLLIEPVGRAEEQIALQAHTLDLVAVAREDGELVRSAIQRRAILGAVEAELDGIHAARAYRKRRTADDQADQHACDKSPFDDDQRDGDEGAVFH